MKKHTNLFLLIFFLLSTLSFAQVDTLRLATYNILNFPGNNYEERAPYFRIVVHTLKPDILVVQEMDSQDGVDYFLNDILNYYSGNKYTAAPFINGYDSDNALFYRSDKLTLVSNRQIPTALRDISEYILSSNNIVNPPEFRVYSIHLKASQGTENKEKRLAEVTLLRNELNDLPVNTHFFICGDYNIYTHTEPAWDMLTGSQADDDGRCFDPISRAGSWHNNENYVDIHTQSTRTTQFGGGASGGLDDRFDMILFSNDVESASTYTYLYNSYTAYGNDGNHFNGNINDGVNSAVPDSIADALYYASDHLPVFLDFTISMHDKVDRETSQVKQFSVSQNYPNPFNSSTKIKFKLPSQSIVSVIVYNIHGNKIKTLVNKNLSTGEYTLQWNPDDSPSGLYLVRANMNDYVITRKIILQK